MSRATEPSGGERIRRFQKEDTEAVVALWRACDLVVPWNDPHKDILRKCSADPAGFLVAEALGGEIIGTCMIGFDGHRGWINYLAVAPKDRRRGLGTRLVRAAEEYLEGLGCPKINLQVRSRNTTVLAFYETLGFRRDDVVSLGKRLEADG